MNMKFNKISILAVAGALTLTACDDVNKQEPAGGMITQEQLTALTEGIIIDDAKTAPAEVHVITQEENRVVLEIILYEGRNRQIRKMCEEIGLEVARLRRIAVGSVKLGMLKQGDWRDLTEDEVRKLQLAAGMIREKKTRNW